MASISTTMRLAICWALLASSSSIINCQDDFAAITTSQTVVSDADNDLDNSIGGNVGQQRQSWLQMRANQTGKNS